MLNPIIKNINISAAEYERYSRHIILEEIGPIGQKRLKNARILCIGAGGLGSPGMIYLTACGIGKIGIIDKDRIEPSNLQRQIIYKNDDIGKSKVELARKHLISINPSTKIEIYNIKIDSNNVNNILYKYDIVFDGTDNIKSRQIISRSCKELHKIHVYGAIEKYVGYVSVSNYKNGPSFSEVYYQKKYIESKNCNTMGILNSLAGIVGSIQVTEIIKIITGIGFILSGYILHIDILDMSFKKLRLQSKEIYTNTELKRKDLDTKYITLEEIKKLENNSYQLIDVRQPREFQTNKLPLSINIPMKDLKTLKFINYVKKKFYMKQVIVYCNNELRSLISSQILKKHNIEHKLLSGGLNLTIGKRGIRTLVK